MAVVLGNRNGNGWAGGKVRQILSSEPLRLKSSACRLLGLLRAKLQVYSVLGAQSICIWPLGSNPDQVNVVDQFGKSRAGSTQPRSVFR